MTPILRLPDDPYDRPAIPVTLALIAGIVLADALSPMVAPVIWVLVLSVIWMVCCLVRQRAARWSPLIALAATGCLAMSPWTSPSFGPDHIVNYLDGTYWEIHGRVLNPPVSRLGRTRMDVSVDALSHAQKMRPARGRIRLTVMGEVDPMPGSRVRFASRLRPLRNFNNPGGFDYRRFMAFKGIYARAWVKAESLRIIQPGDGFSAARMLDVLRGRLGRIIDAAGGEHTADAAAVLKALVYGDRRGIDDALRDRFNRSGVGHLLAISGLHVGIVAAVVYRGMTWLFVLVPPLVWRGWTRPWAAAVTVPIVMAYGLLAGMSPSTQRAVTMVTVFLAVLIMGRTKDALNTLATAALVILVAFPPALFSISFQLSFAAVLAIVLGLERIGGLSADSESTLGRTGRRLIGFVLVSLLAIAGTAPLALHYFNQTSLVGVAANLLLVPLVGFLVVPVGLAAAAAALLWTPLAIAGFGLCLTLLRLALMLVDAFAALPFAAVKTVTPSMPELVLYYLAAWAVVNMGRGRWAPWLLAATLILGVGDALYWAHQRFWHRDLRITAIDVGQGAATLVELPKGRVLLYDGGGFADNRRFDIGQLVIAPLLWGRKIVTVDILVLSHPNADHLNGLIYVARHFNVRELWTNGDVNTTWGYRELMAVCRERSIAVRPLDRSSASIELGAVELAVLHPPPPTTTPSDGSVQRSRNDLSLVIRLSHGDNVFLLTGDIAAPGEAELVRHAGRTLASRVLFAPHHGSRTSSSAALVAAVRPDVVVISAGFDNRFGFPHGEVTARYRSAGSRILCTASHGAVMLRSDGYTVQVTTHSDPADRSTARR